MILAWESSPSSFIDHEMSKKVLTDSNADDSSDISEELYERMNITVDQGQEPMLWINFLLPE